MKIKTETKHISEKYNDEIVAEQRGAEEYVHLKSVDDEFEFMESSGMPKKSDEDERRRAPTSPQLSPRVTQEEQRDGEGEREREEFDNRANYSDWPHKENDGNYTETNYNFRTSEGQGGDEEFEGEDTEWYEKHMSNTFSPPHPNQQSEEYNDTSNAAVFERAEREIEGMEERKKDKIEQNEEFERNEVEVELVGTGTASSIRTASPFDEID